ncbi:heme-binding protein, partial [bacterium]|nr:heme-binding protein [bacterium]
MWVTLCSLILFVFPMTSQATEEPDYKVVQKLEDIEVREYAAYVVAEVVVSGPAEKAGNLAFPILAGYIFGKNKGTHK